MVKIMIKKGCEIIGLPVICLDVGCKAMEVKDIIYNKDGYQLVGFVIEEGKYFHEKKIIRVENIEGIGESLVVEKKEYIEKVQLNPDLYSTIGQILGKDILTESGEDMGVIQDFLIDLTGVKLTGIIITEGIFDDLMEGRPILPVQESLNLNNDHLVISNAVSQSIVYNTGGLKRMMSLE